MCFLRNTNLMFKYNPGYDSFVDDFCTALKLGIMIGHSKAGTKSKWMGFKRETNPIKDGNTGLKSQST
jgi:hypothetical protein